MVTGYQQGILMALGSQQGEKFAVRSIDRWYPDQVQEFFGTTVYSVSVPARGHIQWTVKSSRVVPPTLDEISDWAGFCRAYIEIHSCLDLGVHKNRDGSHSRYLRLRIYGSEPVLQAIMAHLPAPPRHLHPIRNHVQGGYIGQTNALDYQSPSQVLDIIDFLRGEPHNSRIWEAWKISIEESKQGGP